MNINNGAGDVRRRVQLTNKMFPLSKLITDIEPDRIGGKYGKAWRWRLTEARKIDTKPDATVCGWIIEAPWAHPAWANYVIAALHLRPLSNEAECEPLRLYRPDATHELVVAALDPGETPDLIAPMRTHLTPLNFAAQWNAGTDFECERTIESCVEDIIAGRLNPDTDARRQWIARFNGSMVKGHPDHPDTAPGQHRRTS